MSDDRFTYIHLPHETSLWCYGDDQVDWAINSLDDRIDQSVWDLIPPYQNEDDEGLLPSNTHPSYPYGNPYEQSSSFLTNPTQSTRLLPTNSLASGTSLLATTSSNPSNWNELAIDNLLGQEPNESSHHQSTSDQLEAQNPNTAETSNRAPVLPTHIQTQTPRTPVGVGNAVDLINPTWDDRVGSPSDDSDQDLVPQI